MGKLSWTRWRPIDCTCLLCHASGAEPNTGLCSGCLADLLVLAPDHSRLCPRCGGISSKGSLCGHCQRRPPPFDAVWSSVRYAPPISGLLHHFKHLRDVSLAKPLAAVMNRLPPPWLAEAEYNCVLPMPLSAARRLERGFNQCEEWMPLLALRPGCPILPIHAVLRLAGPPLSTLALDERAKNIRGKFVVHNSFKNCKVLLIDDVHTSGATLGELSRGLKRAGAEAVYCWTLASAKVKIF